MNIETRPSKPVVPSQVAASKDFSRWLLESRREAIVDAEGQSWKVCFSFIFDDPSEWRVNLWLELSTNMDELIELGVFDTESDRRTIELVGESIPLMKLRPRTLTGKTQEECLVAIKAEVVGFSEVLSSMQLKEIKRNIVFQYLDNSLKFGMA